MKRRQFVLGLAAGGVLLAGCSPVTRASASRPPIVMGSTNFGEQLVVAELYAQALEASGYTITRKFNLGSREIVAPALASGQIDMYPEYLASYLTFLTNDPSKAGSDPAKTYAALQQAVKAKNLTALQYAPAQDENCFVVTKATADKYKLAKLSDLAPLNGQLVLGGPPECPQRPFCLLGLESVYGLRFRDLKALDAGGPLTVAALVGGQIDVGELFTSDPAIAANNLVLLQDDKHLELSDNIVPVVRTAIVDQAAPNFATIVNGVSAKLTTSELTGLNKQLGLDKKDPKDVAGPWLKAHGLTG